MHFPLLAFLLHLHYFLSFAAASDLSSDRAALLSLRSALSGRTLFWNTTSPTPCSWPGVQCDSARVVALRLPGSSLSGAIPPGIFGNLTQLRTLSLRMNSLSGTLPPDLGSCVELRNLYLQGNRLSGSIPGVLLELMGLVRVSLAGNEFSGPIPAGFGKLTRLRTLLLENNKLSGVIPPGIKGLNLMQFNVSANQLNGSIPEDLQGFDGTSFLGNSLCGKPLASCSEDIVLPSPSGGNSSEGAGAAGGGSSSGGDAGVKRKKLSGSVLAGIVIGCVFGFLLLLILLIFICRRMGRKSTRSVDIATIKHQEMGLQDGMRDGAYEVGGGYVGNGSLVTAPVAAPTVGNERQMNGSVEGRKLVFMGKSGKVFGLEDLLRASAEVLGKGTFGTAYKAVLEAGIMVAVKRLRDVNISAAEFQEKIEAVGAMDHENLMPLMAYYYSNDEKLLVYDYMPTGSLSALLHGNKGASKTPLNWEMRSTIALGAARGIQYLHSQGPNVSHGNIKSSNVLLTKSYDARVSDFGLAQLVGPPSSPTRVAGYRAPEVTDPRKVSQQADVYSFGVLLLELLTGKAPANSLLNEEGVDLPRWVQSVVREEWTSEVFDLELLRYQNIEEQMVDLLQLAVDCAAQYPDQRPSMSEVMRRIEDLCRYSWRENTQQPDQVSDSRDS
ncbi:hypothetical protein MLD38_032858 [Melastoma candidum]|uniref:Uncharacterized protein n=1 Tax=Melastoma candidum TaxID=119954 RepID=A0ACB9M6Y3_9MYRT|nr:hypothetical protein MLD38_032858 [Melastoma candidum]